MSLSDSFLRSYASRLDNSDLDTELLEHRLREKVESGRKAWPSFELRPNDFAEYLSTRVSADSPSLLAAIDRLHIDDLYLACACARGLASAIETFDSLFGPTISRSLRRFDATGALADEAAQIIRERLFVGTPERPAKILAYDGHGQLRRWVRAIATRIGLDLVRDTAREKRRYVDGDILSALPDPREDPEFAHLRSRYSSEFKRAFEQAIETLPPKQRTLIRYHLVDGLNIDQIGSMFQVHRTTAFRWLRRAREKLIAETREALRLHAGVSRGELDSLLRLVDSHVDLSLQRLLEPKQQ